MRSDGARAAGDGAVGWLWDTMSKNMLPEAITGPAAEQDGGHGAERLLAASGTMRGHHRRRADTHIGSEPLSDKRPLRVGSCSVITQAPRTKEGYAKVTLAYKSVNDRLTTINGLQTNTGGNRRPYSLAGRVVESTVPAEKTDGVGRESL